MSVMWMQPWGLCILDASDDVQWMILRLVLTSATSDQI